MEEATSDLTWPMRRKCDARSWAASIFPTGELWYSWLLKLLCDVAIALIVPRLPKLGAALLLSRQVDNIEDVIDPILVGSHQEFLLNPTKLL